jgi:hypothetical protein
MGILPAIAAPASKKLTRTGIMLSILPSVMVAFNAIPEVKSALGAPVTPETAGTVRRAFRALLTVGIRIMLDAGASPGVVVDQMQTALLNEIEERKVKAKQDGATQAPATLPS